MAWRHLVVQVSHKHHSVEFLAVAIQTIRNELLTWRCCEPMLLTTADANVNLDTVKISSLATSRFRAPIL